MYRRRRRAGREGDNEFNSVDQGADGLKLTIYEVLCEAVRLFEREEDTYKGVQSAISAYIRHLESQDFLGTARYSSFTNVLDLFSEPRNPESQEACPSSSIEPHESPNAYQEKSYAYYHRWRTKIWSLREKYGMGTGTNTRPEPAELVNTVRTGRQVGARSGPERSSTIHRREKVGPSTHTEGTSGNVEGLRTELRYLPRTVDQMRGNTAAVKPRTDLDRQSAVREISTGGSAALGPKVGSRKARGKPSQPSDLNWSSTEREGFETVLPQKFVKGTLSERENESLQKHAAIPKPTDVAYGTGPSQGKKKVQFPIEFQPRRSRRQAQKAGTGTETITGISSHRDAFDKERTNIPSQEAPTSGVQDSDVHQPAVVEDNGIGKKRALPKGRVERSEGIDDLKTGSPSHIPGENASHVGKRPRSKTKLDVEAAPNKRLATAQVGEASLKSSEICRTENKASDSAPPEHQHSPNRVGAAQYRVRTRSFNRETQKKQTASPRSGMPLERRPVTEEQRSQLMLDVFGAGSPLKATKSTVQVKEDSSFREGLRSFPSWYMQKSRASAMNLEAFKNWRETMLDNMNISYGLYSLDNPGKFCVSIDTRILSMLAAEGSNQEDWITKYDITDVEGLNNPLQSDWFIIPFHTPDYQPAHWTLIAIQGLRASCEHLRMLVSKDMVPRKGDKQYEDKDDFGIIMCMDSMGLELSQRVLKVFETLVTGLLHQWFRQNQSVLKRKHSIMIQHVVRQFTSRLCHACTPVQAGHKECGSFVITNAHYLMQNHSYLLRRVCESHGFDSHVAMRQNKGDLKMFKVAMQDLYETTYVDEVLKNTHKKVSDIVKKSKKS